MTRKAATSLEKASISFRATFLFLLVTLLLAPLALMLYRLLIYREGWQAWQEYDRIASLLGNTALLAVIACVVALPVGATLAVTLERFRFPGRRLFQAIVLLGLFIPLPVYAIAWQVVLGVWLPPWRGQPGEIEWRPWSQGLLPAGWVHGCVAIPWVTVIVAMGLRLTHRGLEEEAYLTRGLPGVFRDVLLPRLFLVLLAAMLWIVVQTLTEIPISDVMMVRTFAEEVYTQVVGYPDGVQGAIALSLPFALFSAAILGLFLRQLAPRLQISDFDASPPRRYPLDAKRQFACFVVVGFLVFLWGVLPMLALLWKAAGGGSHSGMQIGIAVREFDRAFRLHAYTIAEGYIMTLITGAIAVGLASAGWWATRHRVRSQQLLLGVTFVIWLMPGPVVGLALKQAIGGIVECEDALFRLLGLTLDFPPLRSLLYDQPSPVPGIWACVVRFFPLAVMLTWPGFHTIARELWEQAWLDGLSAGAQWRLIVLPLLLPMLLLAVVAIAILSLGEVSASKIVVPPGRRDYILELFNQAHYGAESTVAAMAVVQLTLCLLLTAVLRMAWAGFSPRWK